MSDTKQDKLTLSMKVLKGPKQIEREKTETIWDRFDRLQRSLAPLRKGKHIKKGEFILSEELKKLIFLIRNSLKIIKSDCMINV